MWLGLTFPEIFNRTKLTLHMHVDIYMIIQYNLRTAVKRECGLVVFHAGGLGLNAGKSRM